MPDVIEAAGLNWRRWRIGDQWSAVTPDGGRWIVRPNTIEPGLWIVEFRQSAGRIERHGDRWLSRLYAMEVAGRVMPKV